MPQFSRGRRTPDSIATGFSLLEMLVALAIVGILAAIALVSYDSASSRTRRQAAAACLGEVAAALERERAASYSYPAGNLPAPSCATELARHYRFGGDVAAESFRVSAEPLGRQAAADDACGCTLTLDETGRKGTAGTSACAANGRVSACW
jgi:type IV pilus assembly protein PilE